MSGLLYIDVLVIGAGPAGTQCAMTLDNQVIKTAIVNKARYAGGLQSTNPYRSDWIATNFNQTGIEIAENMEKNLQNRNLDYFINTTVTNIIWHDEYQNFTANLLEKNSKELKQITSHYIILATGVTPRKGPFKSASNTLFGPGIHISNYDFKDKRVAILGGGDNGFENFDFITKKGARNVDLYCNKIIARDDLKIHVPADKVFIGDIDLDQDNNMINGIKYDVFCVFYGWSPNLIPFENFKLHQDEKGYLIVDRNLRTNHEQIFAIGEINYNDLPSVTQSMAEGMRVGKVIAQELSQIKQEKSNNVNYG